MASLKVGVLADDLTGALASAARLRAAGLRTIVRWTPVQIPEGVEALVVDMRTRDYATARASTAQWARALSDLGCRWFELRADSTLRGSTAAELDAVLTALGRPDVTVLAVPAFPSAGRCIVDGRLVVDGVDTGVNAVRALFPSGSADRIGIDVVERGADAVVERVRSGWNAGARRLLADARTEHHLQVIATAASRLSAILRGGLISISSGAWLRYLPAQSRSSYVLVVLSSATDTNRRQLARLVAEENAGVVNAHDLLDWLAETDTGADDLPEPLQQQVVVVETLSSPVAEQTAAGMSHVAAAAAGRLMCIRGIIGDRCVGVVVGGGHTASALMDQLRVSELRVEREIAPLCPLARIVDGPWSGLPIITKGGLIGDQNTLTTLVANVRREGT